MALHLAIILEARRCPYEALDTSAMPVRDAKRRGRDGWADRPTSGGPTAWAGTRDSACSSPAMPRSDHRLWLRQCFHQRPAVGRDFLCPAGSDRTLGLRAWGGPPQDHTWAIRTLRVTRTACGGGVITGRNIICPPRRNAREEWPKRLRRWAASIRQIVETACEKRDNSFGLRRDRPTS